MRRPAGFTLIELMIAVIVIGILAAVAIPNYTQYVKRSNQSAAQQFLSEAASRAEQYRMDARAYPESLGSGSNGLDVSIPDGVDEFYAVSISTSNGATPPKYELEAEPRAGTNQEGMPTLTLDSTGNKSPSDAW